MKPCLAIPIFDHSETIGTVVESLASLHLPCIIVDDGSGGATRSELGRLEARHAWVEVVRHDMPDVAGAPIGDHIQGRSLVPLLRGSAEEWRQSAFIEFYTYENPFPWLLDMDYRAIRTNRYKYIHWIQHPDENELYDLEQDPYEMQNLIDDPRLAGVVSDLRAEMAAAVLDAMGLAK